MSPRKLWLSYLAVLAALIIVAIVLIAKPAHADDAPGTKTVAWVVTSPDGFADRFETPQILATADACGVLEQVDVYRYDTPEHIATVDALIASGKLDNSGEDGSVWISNQDVTLPACTQPTAPTTPPTPPATTAPPAPVVTATPSATPSPVTPTSTPTTAAPTSVPVSKPIASATATATLRKTTTAPELAFTGSTGTWLGAIVAGLLVLSGIGIVIYSRKKEDQE